MTTYYKDYSTLGNRARQVWGTGSRPRLKQGDGSFDPDQFSSSIACSIEMW